MTRSFAAFLARRIGAAALLVAVVSSGALVITRLAPGDATTELFLSGASQATIDAARVRWGLDRPLLSQLGAWAGGIARFDLGRSSAYERPVAPLVIERAANTATLAAVALVLATLVGLPLGVLTGARPRGWLSAVVTPMSIALVACPPIVGALVILLLVVTGWLPVSTTSLVVPALAIALPLAATIERLQSQATSDAIGGPDIMAAAARGVPPARLLWVHTARQSLRPVLGVYGIMIGGLFSGSLAVEIVTSWPGLGQLMYHALRSRDVYLVAGCALFGALFLAAGNLVADVARAVADPPDPMSAVLGRWLLILTGLAAALAPLLSPNRPSDQFADRAYAPPTRVHLRDASGFRAPFVYKQVLVNRMTSEYGEDTSAPVPLVWGANGRLASVPADEGPLLLLGADALGRDTLSRLLFGARLSLGVTILGAIGALAIGALVGGLAGAAGGRTDTLLMFVADFMLVLPAVYLVLVFRASLQPALTLTAVFGLMAVIFALVGWPRVARGVRGIVATEWTRDYTLAARAAGAGPFRVLGHLLPATRGFLGVELVLLVPAMLMAETTMSYLGLGFPEDMPSWGTMLQETSNVHMMGAAPWLLAPAVALFAVVLALQLVARAAATGPRTSHRVAPSYFRATPRPSANTIPGRG